MLECNHDEAMLAGGRYPYPLKQRIAGRLGHLCNDAAADLLRSLDTSRLRHIVAAHCRRQQAEEARVVDRLRLEQLRYGVHDGICCGDRRGAVMGVFVVTLGRAHARSARVMGEPGIGRQLVN